MTYEELKHYYDSTVGLWAIDRSPQEVSLTWIVENAFRLGIDDAEVSNLDKIEKDLKPFNLEAAKAGKPVCTRDGSKARIICFDKKGAIYPIVTLVEECGEEHEYFYDTKGKSTVHPKMDLMMLSEKHEGWINIYKTDNDKFAAVTGSAYLYKTEREAKIEADPDTVLATVKICWKE